MTASVPNMRALPAREAFASLVPNMHASREAIVAQITPLIDACIDEFESHDGVGADDFSVFLVERLRAHGMCTATTEHIRHFGVHPDNREGGMLVGVDVHQLLREIIHRGWIDGKCNVMACRVPQGTNCMLKTYQKSQDAI